MLLKPSLKIFAVLLVFVSAPFAAQSSGLPVREAHPRILLDSATKAKLIAKKNANHADWIALKNRADLLKNYTIQPYTYATRGNWYNNSIFYSYQGSTWYESTMQLALAWQISGDTNYCNKLLALADEMYRAEYDTVTNGPQRGPFQVNVTYASRYVGTAVAIIYDWCYDRLGSTRRQRLVQLMNRYFDHLRLSQDYTTYEKLGPAGGNYFGGHFAASAYMGYATFYDNQRAQHMIDWARIRFDGTNSTTLTPGTANGDIPEDNRVMAFEGNYKSRVGRMYQSPGGSGAPFKGGFNYQGWSYGNNEFVRMIEYMLTVKTATGEDLISTYQHWFTDMLRAAKHALYPNKLNIDPVADWGGNQGAIVLRGLPSRLAYILAETTDSAAAQHFAYSDIGQNGNYGHYAPHVTIYQLLEWEKFFFFDPTRTMAAGNYELYNSAFGPAYPQAGATNGALPRFIQRNNWTTNATWIGAEMGASHYGDHMMHHAGHIYMTHGSDQLLISPSNWRGTAPGLGVIGSGVSYVVHSSLKNTLFFDDYGVYSRDRTDYSGGQGPYGTDRVIAAIQNNDLTYAKSDLTSAYYNLVWPRTWADTNNRSLDYFYRSFLYLRSPNLVIVYDQIQAKNSAHANGQYEKNIRWHFPVQPVVNGKSVAVTHANSKLFLHTLLPQSNLRTKTVSLVNNPDNKWGSSMNYAFNSPTWRIEVKDSTNPLTMPVLTVLQPGDNSLTEMTTSSITTNDSLMIGARIVSGGITNYVLFNNRLGQVPMPITTTTYSITGNGTSMHTLCGVTPNAVYDVSIVNSVVTVSPNVVGAYTANAAGVLQFEISTGGAGLVASVEESIEEQALKLYPNPAQDAIEIDFNGLLKSGSKIEIMIFGTNGIMLQSFNTQSGRMMLDISAFANGIYYCQIKEGGNLYTQKFSIIK
ncbi:MAG TPA: T9SS type A sorting domain-containing protein [Patescibacteria group bacterium]|nr:T9SS type A sorting domain-containing protein [Patescibacteria group bacterium]